MGFIYISDAKTHNCSRSKLDFALWGDSITSIIHEPVLQKWFAYNGEYATQIIFCPFCGIKLENN